METNRIGFGFKNALAGLGYFFRHERNGRVQLVISALTALAGVLFHISRNEWIAVLLCTGGVLSAEMMNSALEKLCDHLHPSFHFQIKIVKDVSAGAVLFIAMTSAAIGAIIFLPKLWQLI